MPKKQNLNKFIVNMRMLDKRLDRQRRKIQKDELKMKKEVREALEKDDMDTARLFAKDMARSRKMAYNLQTLRSRVKTMTFKLEQANAVQQIGMDLRGLVKTLYKVNRSLNVSGMENILFAMENEMEHLNITTETIEEGLDSMTLEGEDEDQEANKILEEMKATRVAETTSSLASGDSLSDDIEERLKKLRSQNEDST